MSSPLDDLCIDIWIFAISDVSASRYQRDRVQQCTNLLLVSWLRSGFVVVHRELSGETCPVDPTKNQLGQDVQDAGVYLKMLCLNIFKETFKEGWIGRGKLPCEG